MKQADIKTPLATLAWNRSVRGRSIRETIANEVASITKVVESPRHEAEMMLSGAAPVRYLDI